MAEKLQYQRLLEIIRGLPPNEAEYVLKFLLANDQQCRRKAAELEHERREYEQTSRELRRKKAEADALAARGETSVRLMKEMAAVGRKRRAACGALHVRVVRVLDRPELLTDEDLRRSLQGLAEELTALLVRERELREEGAAA